MPQFSITVPVYNVQNYLAACVKSVAEQPGPRDWECILVDDGSPDTSGQICDVLAAEVPGLRVLHQQNGGLANARNTGLDNARGDYIGIVDSDDLIEPTMFATLYSAVQVDGVRLAACAGDCIDADGKKIEYVFTPRVNAAYHGTGDVFASALTCGIVIGKPLSESVAVAAKYTAGCIERTYRENPDIRYGVNFEGEIPNLLKLLNII